MAKKRVLIISGILVLLFIIVGSVSWIIGSASWKRFVVDVKSDISNGMQRTIKVYTADGKMLAEYEGKIDIEESDNYVKFDYDGKRYIYYNCFVESIADIN